ncbi:MAG: AtpZ/AtpI family protein [Pseudomonadota bacterium]
MQTQQSGDGEDRESGDLDRRLAALDAKLQQKASAKADESAAENSNSSTSYGNAFRLSSEFIGGIVTGGLIGYLIDHFAGTSPWGLIVFILLGFVAGIFNVLRSAGMMAKPEARLK